MDEVGISQRPRALRVRAVRHILLTSAVVLLACGVVAVVSAVSYLGVRRELDPLTARGHGVITAIVAGGVEVRWSAPAAGSRIVVVPLAVHPAPVGTATEVAYDASHPEHAIVPGASVLADADRARCGLILAALVGGHVLLVVAWRVVSRARLVRRPGVVLPVRRVRFQRGLITRSWLEFESGRWVPVYFDPVLVGLPSPASGYVHGPDRRLVAVEVNGTVLYPSGRAVSAEPRGRRIDNPLAPDDTVAARALAAGRLRRQLRVDAATMLPAPVVGLLWSYVDSSGFTGFVGATAVCAVVALWLGSLRGSDPS
jgi:hypothetical protein